jgi:ECF sigma factor
MERPVSEIAITLSVRPSGIDSALVSRTTKACSCDSWLRDTVTVGSGEKMSAQQKQQQDITAILGRARAGDERAKGELVAMVYGELRPIAARLMRRERTGHTLSTTGVVHEAMIRRTNDIGTMEPY